MKQILFISVFFLLFGCASDTKNADDNADSIRRADSMSMADSLSKADSVAAQTKTIDTAETDSTPAEPTYPAKFKITFTSNYCGGARPTEEILADKATQKTFSSSSLTFKNHFTGKQYTLKTNSDGIAEAQMEEGKYDVFLTKDINANLGTGFDPKCNTWLKQLLLTVKVTSAGKTQDVNIHFVCNPCDENMKRQ